jgi:DNA-binding NtrC family response regulator
LPKNGADTQFSEREILYKVLFDMKGDLNDLKKLVLGMIQSGGQLAPNSENAQLFEKVFTESAVPEPSYSAHPATYSQPNTGIIHLPQVAPANSGNHHVTHEVVEESLSLTDSEKELIRRALQKHNNKRKYAAKELGISERTLYRKIKEFNLHK